MSDQGKPFVITGTEELKKHAGTEIGTGDWVTVTQDQIDTFADLTGDHQWIHVDQEKAKEGPYGTTIQYGFLTLGKSTGLLWDICVVEGHSVILNYGVNKVRFPAPLRTGKRYRMKVELPEVNDIKGGVEAIWRCTFEIEDEPKPCCVADLVFRYYD